MPHSYNDYRLKALVAARDFAERLKRHALDRAVERRIALAALKAAETIDRAVPLFASNYRRLGEDLVLNALMDSATAPDQQQAILQCIASELLPQIVVLCFRNIRVTPPILSPSLEQDVLQDAHILVATKIASSFKYTGPDKLRKYLNNAVRWAYIDNIKRESKHIPNNGGREADRGGDVNSNTHHGGMSAVHHFRVDRSETKQPDYVHFSVSAPMGVARGILFRIDVWAHLETQRLEVLERAKSLELGPGRQLNSKGPFKVARDSYLTLALEISGITKKRFEDSLTWVGEIANATFDLKLPKSATIGEKLATVRIRAGVMEIARLNFVIFVGDATLPVDLLHVQNLAESAQPLCLKVRSCSG